MRNWILLLALMQLAFYVDHKSEDRVYRCKDEIIDTGRRMKNGARVLRLVRTGCGWVKFEKPDITAIKIREYEDSRDDCSSDY